MPSSTRDIVSNQILAVKGGLGTLVELVENWILSLGSEEERKSLLLEIDDIVRKSGDSLPPEKKERILANLGNVLGSAPTSGLSSVAFREKLQKLFREQIEGLGNKVDLLLKNFVALLDEPCGATGDPATGIIMAQEEERKRISREIHDGPAQSLAALTMRIDFCLEKVNDPKVLTEELVDLKDSIGRSLKDIRRFIFDLRPMALDDLGLVPTLEQFIAGFKGRTGVNAHIDVQGTRVGLSPEVELAVFRVIQEAVNNSYKHARAKAIHVFIAFDADNRKVSSMIKDDGAGFDLLAVRKAYGTLKKLGLISMEERIRCCGGEFEIVSSPGEGTVVSFWVPLPAGK